MLPTSLDPTVWMELPPSSWDEILKLTGEHERLSGRPFDAPQLWESLQAKKPNVHLEDALKSIHHLGTDEGRELIAQAAQDQNLELPLPDDVPSRKLAADLWVRSRRPGEEPLARVLFLANVLAEQVTQPRSSFDYVGSRPLATQLDIPRLKSTVLAWSKANTEHKAVEVSSTPATTPTSARSCAATP